MTVPQAWGVKYPGLNPALLMIRAYVGEIEVTLPVMRRETTSWDRGWVEKELEPQSSSCEDHPPFVAKGGTARSDPPGTGSRTGRWGALAA